MTARAVIARAASVALGNGGDDLHLAADGAFTARSGARLTLQKYRYDDGTELAVSNKFYDTALHTRCAPQPWRDGALRCVPAADDAEYTDAGCTLRLGLARTIAKPTYFVAPDTAAGGAIATRVFHADAAAPPITQYYALTGGVCTGPIAVPSTLTNFFAVGDELDGDDQPVVAAAAAPSVARLVEPSGCASYHSVGAELSPPVYRETGGACGPADAPPGGRMFAVGPAIELPALHRTLDDAPGRRLRRVVLDLAPEPGPDRGVDAAATQLRVFDDRLFDTVLGADCRPRTLRGAIRCLPVAITTATVVFTAGCTTPVLVAEVPQHACEPPAYATANRPFQIRPVGDPAPGPLFRFDGTTCTPYAGAPGNELRALGAPIDPTIFLGAIYYGERSP